MATPDIKLVREGEIEEASGAIWAVYVVLNPAWNKRLADNPACHRAFKTMLTEGHSAIAGAYEIDHLSIKKGLKSDRFYFETISF